MNNRVVVLGSCSVCHVFTSPELPARGETLIGDDYHIVVGGKGSGQAIVAQKLGGDVFLLERLGDDAYGRAEKQSYEEMGMHTEFVHLDTKTPTGSAGIFLDANGQNKIVVVPGANGQVSCSDVDCLRETIAGAKILGAQLEVPLETVDHAIRIAAALGVRTMLDPAPVAPIDESLYPCISIMKPNEREAQLLTGVPVTDSETAAEAARILLNKGVREAVIITEFRSPVVGRVGLGAGITVLNSVKIIQRIIISGLQAAALSAQNSFPVKGHSSHLLSGMRRYL